MLLVFSCKLIVSLINERVSHDLSNHSWPQSSTCSSRPRLGSSLLPEPCDQVLPVTNVPVSWRSDYNIVNNSWSIDAWRSLAGDVVGAAGSQRLVIMRVRMPWREIRSSEGIVDELQRKHVQVTATQWQVVGYNDWVRENIAMSR